MRRIAIVTTSRADYGIYRPLLHRLVDDSRAELMVVVGGMHLLREHGMTVAAIEADGFQIADRVEFLLHSDSPEAIALSMGLATQGFARTYARLRPDIVVVLGDRFEMHAAAVAASPFAFAIAHIHGGELTSGALDDAWRHAITKLAHLHFVSTAVYARRVAQMGEEDWRIHGVGALGLDNFASTTPLGRTTLEERLKLDLSVAPLVVTMHPETLGDSDDDDASALLTALSKFDHPIVITATNADPGNRRLRERLNDFAASTPQVRLVESLGTEAYFGLLRIAAAMVGNSSSGLIEAPSFGLPVINIGHRQDGRIRGANIIDCANEASAIEMALRHALEPTFRATLASCANPYQGVGPAAPQIAEVLLTTALDRRLLRKLFVDRMTK